MKWTLVVACVFALLVAAPAEATPAHQVQVLKAKIRRLHREVRATKAERDEARAAVAAGLPAQVRQVALLGQVSVLAQSILEPVKAAWPCGASIFQGQSLWSLDLDLSSNDYVAETSRSCAG